MKVAVELSDEQVAAFLQENINILCLCMAKDMMGLEIHQIENLIATMTTCHSMNETIKFLGGVEVDLPGTIRLHLEKERNAQ